MPICKQCSIHFHHCVSCQEGSAVEKGFCSDKCLGESGLPKKMVEMEKKLIESLTEEQKQMIREIGDYNEYWYFEI